jgi:hypothetical protein
MNFAIDNQLRFTANGIPVSLKPFFQEYNLDDLDPAQDAFTIIERTLMYGSRSEIHWLFALYGRERLQEWMIRAGWRILPRRRIALWGAYFGLENLPKRKNAWPH